MKVSLFCQLQLAIIFAFPLASAMLLLITFNFQDYEEGVDIDDGPHVSSAVNKDGSSKSLSGRQKKNR